MEEYFGANRDRWNELAAIHAKSEFYGVEGFKAGASTLTSIERGELGDVAGKTLLHLQCHFGLDTLSWARLGAQVTGVDFSDSAIYLARSLGKELGIESRFVLSNIYGLPSLLDEEFDIVFTSYGVLAWLPDLTGWARIISRFLRPGGTFYMVEFHPFAGVFYDGDDADDLRVSYPYFHSPKPLKLASGASYADSAARVSHDIAYEWTHGIGEIVSSLISAGLTIEFLHEFPYCAYRQLPMMTRGDDGWWRLPEQENPIPLMFSLKAVK